MIGPPALRALWPRAGRGSALYLSGIVGILVVSSVLSLDNRCSRSDQVVIVAAEDSHWIHQVGTRHDSPTRFVITVDVLVDQTFRATHGSSWREVARQGVMASSDLLEEVDVTLGIASFRSWDSDPGTLPDMLSQALAVPHRKDAALIVLVSHESMTYPQFDGWAVGSEPAIALKVTGSNLEELPGLMTHEIGHLLGAHHHEEGHACPGGGCVMQAVGYRHAHRWCDNHRQAILETLGTI